MERRPPPDQPLSAQRRRKEKTPDGMPSLTALRTIFDPGERETARAAVRDATLDRRATAVVFV